MGDHLSLFTLTRSGQLATVRQCVTHNRLLYAQRDSQGNNLLMVVASLCPWIGSVHRHGVPLVRRLLQDGASVEATNHRGQTALFQAVAAGSWDVVRTLVGYDADVNVVTTRGETILLQTIEKYYRPHSHWTYLGGMVNINQTNRFNQTPLGRAIRIKRWHWVRWLMDHHARIDDDIDDRWFDAANTPSDIQHKTHNLIHRQTLFITTLLVQDHHWHPCLPGVVMDYIGNTVYFM
jgi:hypothetical protein